MTLGFIAFQIIKFAFYLTLFVVGCTLVGRAWAWLLVGWHKDL